MRKLLFTLLFIIFLSGFSSAAIYPQGDLTGDCKVNWEDAQAFAEQWLDPGGCSHFGCADFDSINGINLADFSVLAGQWQHTGIALVINEFMASNSRESGIADPQGQYDDWVEIYNFGETDIDIGGMYLTDDLDDPTKWQIPEGFPGQTTVAADGFIVFWADEDTDDGPLHADIKLSAGGEDIGLFLDSDTMIDGITFGDQVSNISYGRYPDANDNMRFFVKPTPLADNNAVYEGIVEQPEFSHERGFYETGFNLTIATTTKGAQIYYTTDGSVPIVDEEHSGTSTEYTGTIAINSTTCLRAGAIKTGWLPSRSITHTYIFDANEFHKALTIISLVGDEYSTFFEPDGIMAIVGGYYDGGGVWQSSGSGSYNHPIQRGIAYERPVSFEILDPDTGFNYQDNCGIRVHGSDYTRPRYHSDSDDWLTCWYDYWPHMNMNRFSFNLWFRSIYGNNRLEYAFFPFVDIERYKSIVLRSGHNDACTPFIKDEWTRRLFREMGAAQLTGTFANLYLNGEYKAYYNPCGRLDEEFFQEWFNTDNYFDVIDQGWEPRDGDRIAWDNLINYANNHDLSNTADYEYVSRWVDVEEFIDYLILEIHIANFDWPNNNWAVYREKTDGAKFGFAIWDAEGVAETWVIDQGGWDVNAFTDMPWYSGPGGGLNSLGNDIPKLYRGLKANPEFRQLFADRVYKHYFNGGIMTEAHLLEKWWEVFAEVSAVLPEISHPPVRFVPDEFLPRREELMLKAYHDNDLFNLNVGAPVFNVNGSYKYGGYVTTSDTFTITDPCSAGTIYYTLDGNDPRMPATATTPESTILVFENAAKKVLVPTGDIGTSWRGGSEPYNDSSWTSGTGGVGYETDSGYESWIDIDVESDMHNKNTTCYVRIPFTVDGGELPGYDSLILKASYDDGFVAYINGSEVKRVNFTGTAQWNSSASGGHESYGFEDFDISAHIGTLQAGNNILAIHGLNISTGSSDFLTSVELEALTGSTVTEPNLSPSAIEYDADAGSFNIDKSTNLRSRILTGGYI